MGVCEFFGVSLALWSALGSAKSPAPAKDEPEKETKV